MVGGLCQTRRRFRPATAKIFTAQSAEFTGEDMRGWHLPAIFSG